MDNSTLTRYDNQSNTVVNDYFALQNKGQRLGDTGNDIVRWNQHIFIPVTKSRTIEKIRINDGISDGRIKLSAGDEPQRIAILNDTVAYVTLLNDRIKQFNPTTLEIKNKYISVGPAPEGIAALDAAHPDVRCWTAAIDSHLNEVGYIVPGLGDAGDRLYGTV